MSTSISELISSLAAYANDPGKGLPEELFLFASSITPMVNVDLLVRDSKGRILLSWRDDPLCGKGWHVPGSIVRFQESLLERLQKTAVSELGCEVILETPQPEFIELIRPDGARARSHFVTFIYHCRLPGDMDSPPHTAKQGEAGHLAFHGNFPENMIPVHHVYRKYFRSCS